MGMRPGMEGVGGELGKKRGKEGHMSDRHHLRVLFFPTWCLHLPFVCVYGNAVQAEFSMATMGQVLPATVYQNHLRRIQYDEIKVGPHICMHAYTYIHTCFIRTIS